MSVFGVVAERMADRGGVAFSHPEQRSWPRSPHLVHRGFLMPASILTIHFMSFLLRRWRGLPLLRRRVLGDHLDLRFGRIFAPGRFGFFAVRVLLGWSDAVSAAKQ